MEERERLARILCKNHRIDPDLQTKWIKGPNKGQKYYLWEYQAINYVDIILKELKHGLEN